MMTLKRRLDNADKLIRQARKVKRTLWNVENIVEWVV